MIGGDGALGTEASTGSAPSPAGEPPLYEYTPGSVPLLISFPHSGTYVPAAIAARLRSEVRDLPDTDWFVPELYEWREELGAASIRATHSRFVVDLNRPPDGAPLYPGQRETTVCPLETFDGEPLYESGAEPTAAEITARLARYWRPYHDRLAALTHEIAARHGYCLLWDAHSIRAQVPALFAGVLPDLNLGTADGRSCGAALETALASALAAQARFTQVVNGRFKGGYITRRYGDPGRGIDAVQLEIAQSAYLEPARVPRFAPERAAPLRAVLRDLLAVAVAFLRHKRQIAGDI
jgi:N-formylglutamate deformylase